MGQSVVKNSKKIFSQPGSDPSLNNRVTNLENNVYKITYYEIVSGTSGSLTIPTGATINEGEFGTSGNSILSKINVEDKPTYSSPLTSTNVVVTANLNIDGTWVASGIYTDAEVALVYSIDIKAVDYHNLDNFYIINSERIDGTGGGSGSVTSVGLTMPTAFTVSNSPITSSGDIAVTGAGTTSQYIRGDGTLATFPGLTGFVPYTGATADVDLGTYNLTADHITLNTNPSGAGYTVGTTQWNNTDGTSETLLKGGSVSLKNGVDLVARVVNKAVPNQTLTKAQYQVVKVAGATGGRLSVDLAQANVDLNSADTLGVVIETIATNQEGFIMAVGQLTGINTTGNLQGETWADGDVIYLSPTIPGGMTKVKPNGSTGHIVVLGYVEYAHVNQGKLYIKIMNGWELEELHDVYIPSYVSNGVLYRDTSTNLWRTNTIPSVLGYTPADDSNVVHITGTETITGLKTFTNNTIIGNASSTNQKQLRIGQGTGWLDIGEIGNNIGLWANQNTPSTGNVMLYGNASTTVINATSTIRLGIFSFDYLTLNLGRILFTPQTSASSATIPFEYTVPSNTLQTASTNIPNFKVQGGTKQWAAGAITNQYWNYFTANTAEFATTSSTITNSYGLFVESATVGTNAAITNNFGIGTDGNILSTSQYLYLGTSSPDFTNFTLRSTSSGLEVNSQTQSAPMYFRLGTSNRFIIDKNGTVGAENSFRFLPNNNTNQTASTEISAYLGQNFSRQWIGGNITTQREIYFKAATYNFTTSSIVTNAYGAYFEAATAGTNAFITNNYGLGVKGQVEFDFDGTGKFFRVKDWSGSFSTYGWGIATSNDRIKLPAWIYIGDSSYYINRFDIVGDPVGSLYGGAFNVYKDFKAVGNLNSRIYVYGRNDTGHVGIGTAVPTERLHISGGNLLLEDAGNIVLGTTTGTKIGTATTQKLGFYNATPIVQPSAVTTAQGIANALSSLGLLATSTINTSSNLFELKPSYVWRGATFNNGSATVVYDGGIVGSATAATTAQSVSSTNFVSKQIRLRYYSTTISGGRYTGLRGSALLWYIHGGFLFTCDFNISDTAYNATCQNFYGMAGQTTDLGYGGAGNVQVSALTNLIGVGNDTTDTNLQIIHNDATGTATKIDLGANFPANRTAGAAMTTMYSILLYNAPASTEVNYRVINNETGAVVEGTITTDLPATSQGLNIFASRANGTGGGTTGAGEFHLSKLGAYSLL